MSTHCFIGLGSNLEDPVRQVDTALKELALLPETKLVASSSLYRSAPIGPQDQDDFINAVALIETRLTPATLLGHLQALEQEHRRIRERHWGPRTLDLDILLYGSEQIDTPTLQIPHPQITSRAFVILPLLEIAPDTTLPDGQPLTQWLPALSSQALHRLP